MSSDMATANAEFKVVQAKRSSNQGRRGVSRYGYNGRAGIGRGGHTPTAEEPSNVTRKKTPLHLLHQKAGDKGDREIRLRPQTGRSTSGQTRNGSSSSSSSVGGGSGRDSSSESYHHSSGRHRSGSNSMDGDTGKASKAEKSITSPNRFEKLENLDPDVDDSGVEPSSSSEVFKGSISSKNTDTEKVRDRVGSGATSSSVKSRKGNVVHHHKGIKGHSSDPETAGKPKTSEGSRTTGKHSEHHNELQTIKGRQDTSESKRTSLYGLDNESELDDSRCTDTSLSMNCKNTSSSTSGIEAGPSHESLSSPDELLDLSQEVQQAARKTADRLLYSREWLLELRNHPLSQRKPKLLVSDVLQNDTEQVTDEARLKPLTTLSFLREHESKQGGGSSPSGQRKGSEPVSSRQFYREGQKSLSSSRVARDGKQDWRQQRNSRYDSYYHHHEVEEEPEPEWMEFGPTDRFDVIELKGFDKNEFEKEAHNEKGSKSTGQPTAASETPEWEEEIIAENKDERVNEEKEEEELGKEVKLPQRSKEAAAKVGREKETKEMEEENEFILDGFDFSTGLSIFQELALDADEDERESDASSLLQREAVKTPVQLSNALMKALKVGGDDRAEPASTQTKNQDKKCLVGVASRPVNVLTLDEIQARENIQPTHKPSDKTSDDLGAFNKLVAVLQSSGDIKNTKDSATPSMPAEPKVLQKPQQRQTKLLLQAPPARATPKNTPPVPGEERRVSPVSESSNTNFGFLLEKELGFDDDSCPTSKGPSTPVVSSQPMSVAYQRPTPPPPSVQVQQREYPPPSARPPPPTVNLIARGEPQLPPQQPSMSRLEAIAGMLEKLDRSHLQASYGEIPPNPMATPPNLMANKMRMEQRQQQLAMQMEREREREREKGWHYPEAFVDPSHATPSPELLRSMPPPPRQFPVVGSRLMGPPLGSGRLSSNHWAVEMERKRVYELQQMQMRERERLFQRHQQQQQHGMNPPVQAKMMPPGPTSRPNISLLPTSVMRHIHNTKPNQPLSEMAKTTAASTMANRLDQDLTNKAQQSHSGMSAMLNHSGESAPHGPMDYPPTSQMVSAAPQSHAHPNPTTMMYHRYPSMPQRMSSQHNPYMY